MQKRITTYRFDIITAILVLVFLGMMLFPSHANAWYTTQITTRQIASGEDWFYNYDHVSQDYIGNTNVDWPVAMIFWNSATKTNVHNLYWGYAFGDSTMNMYLQDGGSWGWDTTKGTKGLAPNSIFTHTRVYGRNGSYSYDYSGSWGYYVIGTCHYDGFLTPFDFGLTENAEYQLTLMAISAGKQVSYNSFWCNNYEATRVENDGLFYHHWSNSGYATLVRM